MLLAALTNGVYRETVGILINAPGQAEGKRAAVHYYLWPFKWMPLWLAVWAITTPQLKEERYRIWALKRLFDIAEEPSARRGFVSFATKAESQREPFVAHPNLTFVCSTIHWIYKWVFSSKSTLLLPKKGLFQTPTKEYNTESGVALKDSALVAKIKH